MTINDDLLQIQTKLYHTIKHSYLGRFLPQPVIDKDKLLVYYLLFKENGSYSSAEDVIISVMLVETALDTHETITTESLHNQEENKVRQLTVLSGDYYSSLYYYILAKQPDVQMIKWIAKGIQDFNESKMRFFNNDHTQWGHLFEQLYKIESAMVTKLTSVLGLTDWAKTLSDYFYLKRLNHEKETFLNSDTQQSLFYYIFKKKPDYRKVFVRKIDHCIHETKAKLKAIEQTPLTTPLNILLKHIENEANGYIDRVAEEG